MTVAELKKELDVYLDDVPIYFEHNGEKYAIIRLSAGLRDVPVEGTDMVGAQRIIVVHCGL